MDSGIRSQGEDDYRRALRELDITEPRAVARDKEVTFATNRFGRFLSPIAKVASFNPLATARGSVTTVSERSRRAIISVKI